MAKKIKIIDLFAGVGGLSFGFAHDDNFEIIAAGSLPGGHDSGTPREI